MQSFLSGSEIVNLKDSVKKKTLLVAICILHDQLSGRIRGGGAAHFSGSYT